MTLRTMSTLMNHHTAIFCTFGALVGIATAEIDSEIPIGIEAVTGVRSEYIYKGTKLADQIMDFQLSGEMAYSDYQFLRYGLWYASETREGDFSETGVSFKYLESIKQFDYYVGAKYRNITHASVDSTVELFLGARWHHNELSSIAGEISYDTDQEGWYSELSFRHHHDLNKDAFMTFTAGVSAVQHYYGEDGLYDAFARVSYTYNITKTVSFTPFAGTSFQFYGDEDRLLYGGAWFEVSF